MSFPRKLLLCVLGALLLASPAVSLELEGTWHVLVHYKDSATQNPEHERWDDRLWVIERDGSQLRWTEYPIVVFDDKAGRFDRSGTNRMSRVLHHWEPNEAQRAEIRSGLEFNPRGSRNKTLRGSDAKGWSSGGRSGGYQSARFLTYTETWSIEGAELPVFTLDDVLGSASTESVEGRTRYTTESVERDGRVLRGRYERDGTRVGSFRMERAGEARKVRGQLKTDGERVYEMLFGEMAAQLFAGELAPEAGEAELRRMIEAGDVPEEVRVEVRGKIRASIEEQYRAQGNDPRAFAPQIESLTEKIEHAYLDEGIPMQEIQAQIRSGEIRP